MAFHPRDRWPWNRYLSRRDMLRWSAGTVTAGALLAACGTGAESSTASRILIGRPDKPVKQPFFDDNPPIDSDLEPEAGPLRLYNWSDYIWTRVIKDFSEEFDVEVQLTTFYNLEEATRKLRTGQVNFDVFFPTAEIIPKYVAGKLIQPLNHDYLPNLGKNVWPQLRDPFYDGEARYTVPYAVYQTGIGWRTDMVPDDIAGMENPWDAFWNPDYEGIAGLYDDYRETIGVGMYRSGITDINSAGGVEEATKNLLELVDLVNIRYTVDGAYSKLPEGNFGIHHAWSGDMVATPLYTPSDQDPSVMRFAWPPKTSSAGGYISNDSMAVLRGAENPVLAHMFLNYLLDNDHALKNFSWLGYQPPLSAINPHSLVADGLVPDYLESAVITQDDWGLGQTPIQLTTQEDAAWLDAWAQVQAGG